MRWKVFDPFIESLNKKYLFNKGFVRSSRPYKFNNN